jgi:hypothetical protein
MRPSAAINRLVCSKSGPPFDMPPRKPKPPKPPKEPKPWDIRPEAPKGDDKEDMVYSAVGKALTQWERVEIAVALIFAHLSGEQDPDYTSPAVRAFGEVVSFRNRVSMTLAALRAFVHRHSELENYYLKEISAALDEALEYSNRRNEIAHGRVMRLREEETREWLGHYLLPSFFNPKKFSLANKPTFQYVADDILYYGKHFDLMGQKLFALYTFLTKEPRE